MHKMKIIVAVLNWGLGHSSRSVPVITALREEGFEPVLASDGEALLLLRKEFPELQLPSYNISYPRKGSLMRLHFLLKSPHILKAIRAENRVLKAFIAAETGVGGIISDNRFGAFAEGIPSAYMTHQLRVFSGSTTSVSSLFHRFIISKYSEVWIPDLEGPENLSGEMSHGVRLTQPLKYLGVLSRFKKREAVMKYRLLVLLSGPEPQRSMLEEKLLQELRGYKGNILFVRGKILGGSVPFVGEGMEVINYLSGSALEEALNSAELVLARSGYSTIMDLAALGKKAFFIPTPGQFEQEYLAFRMQQQKVAPFCRQEDFILKELEKVSTCTGFPASLTGSSLFGVFALFKGE